MPAVYQSHEIVKLKGEIAKIHQKIDNQNKEQTQANKETHGILQELLQWKRDLNHRNLNEEDDNMWLS